jgi:hypothetical protein
MKCRNNGWSDAAFTPVLKTSGWNKLDYISLVWVSCYTVRSSLFGGASCRTNLYQLTHGFNYRQYALLPNYKITDLPQKVCCMYWVGGRTYHSAHLLPQLLHLCQLHGHNDYFQ